MRTNPNLILRELYGKYILMPVKDNEAGNDPVCLNDVAARIWKAAAASKNRFELQNFIYDMYGLDEYSEEVYAVERFITQLLDNKMIFD